MTRRLQVLLKVANFCDLACDYCYFEHALAANAPGTERLILSESLVRLVAERAAEVVENRAFDAVSILYHGGEPLLIGKPRLFALHRAIVTRLAGHDVRYALQTNGTHLDDEWIDWLIDEQIHVGISMDGDKYATDAHRFNHGRASSYARVESAVKKCVEAVDRGLLFGGALAVVTTETPDDVLRFFRDLGVTATDFLIPNARPTLPIDQQQIIGRRLASLFEQWLFDDSLPDVRLFRSMVSRALGGITFTDEIGGTQPPLITVYPDGRMGALDSLLLAEAEFGPRVHLQEMSFDAFLDTSLLRRVMLEQGRVPTDCAPCPHACSCAGGSLTDRWSEGSFDHPSSNCVALKLLFDRSVELLTRAM
jgi:uncharacterized protein